MTQIVWRPEVFKMKYMNETLWNNKLANKYKQNI